MKRSGSAYRRITLLLACLLLPAPGSSANPVHADGVLCRIEGPSATQPSHAFGTIRRSNVPSGRHGASPSSSTSTRISPGNGGGDVRPRAPHAGRAARQRRLQRARRAAQAHGVSGNALMLMEPWALAITLSMPPMDPADTLDRVLFQRASDRGRPVTGLETAAEQLGLFADLPEAQQLDLLRATLDIVEEDQLVLMFASLTAAWLQGDLAALMAIGENNPMLPDSGRNDAVMERFVDERNERMVERMPPLIEHGAAFVAVGALHLPGERDVLRLLEEAGYTVTPVE